MLVAWNSASICDMILTRPVYYAFKNLRMATLVLIGTSATTAIGKDLGPPVFPMQPWWNSWG